MQELESKPRAGTEEKPDIKALLETANSASERVAGLHVAFMAVCTYVLVIVFGTTDLDLLMGKGVRLPVVNVDVPIVGFYAFAPYLVVLAHFNLLLQLQLLSRKLFAFDAAAPQEAGIGGLRDHLHIFPYTYYLVGRPSPLVQPLIGLMVSITLVLLPLATLLALQLQFLAYQSEAVTWAQRIATWLDVTVVAILWPVIQHPKDDWIQYWRALLAAYVPRRKVWTVFVLLLLGFICFLFGKDEIVMSVGGLFLFFMPVTTLLLYGWKDTPHAKSVYLLFFQLVLFVMMLVSREIKSFQLLSLIFASLALIPLSLFWHPRAPRGSLALLMTLLIGFLIPLALFVTGERLEIMLLRIQGSNESSTAFSKEILSSKRILKLWEQPLLANPPKPEILALIRSGSWREAINQANPIYLQRRSLRQAELYKVILIGGDLRGVDLRGADLPFGNLQGALLEDADLRGVNARRVNLQGANMRAVQLQGANLEFAQLQGANLSGAQLQRANVRGAQLQGAYLSKARLQGTDLSGAQLQGADLSEAQLQGADLSGARLGSADLREVNLNNAIIDLSTKAELIDARKALGSFLDKALRGSSKGYIQSCLAPADTLLYCTKRFDPKRPADLQDFTSQVQSQLVRLSCESPDIARGIIQQIPKRKGTGSSREGLDFDLKRLLEDTSCTGLKSLSSEEKIILREIKY